MNKIPKSTRKDHNLFLLNALELIINENPDLRFGQILQAYGFIKVVQNSKGEIEWINEFYEEPEKVISRVHEAIGKHLVKQ
jgi:hypothetical protein